MKIDQTNKPTSFNSSEEPYEYGYSALMAGQVEEILNVVDENDGSGDEVLPQDLSDVELRLEEANCYKALLRNPLFDTGAGSIARKVEHKVREYIRQELKLLLGLELPKPVIVKDQFDNEELKVLKMLAAKVLNKAPTQEKKELVVNKAQVEPLPAPPRVASKPAELIPQPQKRGRPPQVKQQAKPKPVGEDEVPQIEGPTQKKKILIKGQLVEVNVPISNNKQVRPGPGGLQPLPPLSPEQALMHAQSVVATTAPKSGLLGIAVQNAVKNGIEES